MTFIAAGNAEAVDLEQIDRDHFLAKLQGKIASEAALQALTKHACHQPPLRRLYRGRRVTSFAAERLVKRSVPDFQPCRGFAQVSPLPIIPARSILVCLLAGCRSEKR